jgi:hypothetical protein
MLSSLVSPILSKLATFSIFLGFTMEVKHIQLNREKQTAGDDVRRTSRLSDCQSTFQKNDHTEPSIQLSQNKKVNTTSQKK